MHSVDSFMVNGKEVKVTSWGNADISYSSYGKGLPTFNAGDRVILAPMFYFEYGMADRIDFGKKQYRSMHRFEYNHGTVIGKGRGPKYTVKVKWDKYGPMDSDFRCHDPTVFIGDLILEEE